MIEAILLDGFLDQRKFDQALEEIKVVASAMPTLVIRSQGGDDMAALEFVKRIKALSPAVNFQVKIYEASSAAAFVALALADRIEMKQGTDLTIERGEIKLRLNDFSLAGEMTNERLLGSLRDYDAILFRALSRVGICEQSDDGDKMEMFYSLQAGSIRISAERCLEDGIVQELF